MNLTVKSNISPIEFKDNYPKVDYSEGEFVQDTRAIRNIHLPIFWCKMMQEWLNLIRYLIRLSYPYLGRFVPVNLE